MDMFPSESDWESSSDSGCSEDTEELGFSYGGQASSILTGLEETIGKIDDLLSFEREFIRGDFVCSVTDPSGQMGRVVNVKMIVDLENLHGKIIKNVDSQRILKIRTISVGDYVIHGPWIGKVNKVVDKLTILFDDGRKDEVIAMDQDKILPIAPNLLEDSVYPYHPGQRVQVRLSTAPKSAGWLCGAWKENHIVGTVSAVKAGLVYVDWLGCHSNLPVPPRMQDAKNLTLLSCFLHENWQIGDLCILPGADCNCVKEQIHSNASTFGILNSQMEGIGFSQQELRFNFQEIFVIVKVKTIVDVAWQDGGYSLELDSQSLLPVSAVNAHEFWPGQFVLEKSACDDLCVSSNQRWGVVCYVDSKERTVNVKWKSTGMLMEETVSAYEIVEHPDYSYCFGDIVFKDVDDRHHVRRGTLEDNSSESPTGYASKDHLSCIGYVTGFKDGSVEVSWASGLTTKVAPDDIFRIDKCEDSTTTSLLFEQNMEESSQELVDNGKQISSLKGKDLSNSEGTGEEHIKYECSSLFSPQSTFGLVMNFGASILRSFGSTLLSAPLSPGQIFEDESGSNKNEEKTSETLDLCTEMQPLLAAEMQRYEETSFKDVNAVYQNKEFPSSSANTKQELFRKFDIVDDCSDHHFIDGAGKGLSASQFKRGWLKKVQLEWSILEKDLPESIYLRIYENRMDLLRAAIVGAPGTPYHDGLFFFDIYLPPEYPYEPPLVHYRSGGLRLNPNLYESGKVCLSLLNTWTGTGTEVWDAESSSILQVLISLQALVLNERPYFNEAGYDKQLGKAEGEKNSVSYNENAFLVTWKSMLYLLGQPPKHFQGLVDEHLRQRSHAILLAWKAYMEGASPAFASQGTDQVNQTCSSTGFRIMLQKLFPKLVKAFSDRGIDCHQFSE
ncbi:hypothetical protein K2173_004414 [Erythroxylum novogranatense]|uniref:E2 ubiquitin-conjugating enzyme n=1 Tax=Erythroxylum novogranatense TaxID=1862640 RepID=A0AAV8T525_9ROSI|nr:hypothetical protein K2173_004414 [Erythroxylum novogranatense]